MFDVGLPEMLVILVVGIVVFGPDRLPEFARTAGRAVRQLREFTQNARDEIRSELGPDFADFEFEDLDPRAVVRKQLSGVWDDEEDEPVAPGLQPLGKGEPPPYDDEAT